MEPRAKEWMLAIAKGDYHAIARLLREEPRLARRRVSPLPFFFLFFFLLCRVASPPLHRHIIAFLLEFYTAIDHRIPTGGRVLEAGGVGGGGRRAARLDNNSTKDNNSKIAISLEC